MSAVPLRDEDRPRPAAGYRLEVLDDEVLAYSTGAETLVRLNATAAALWALCDGERTVGQILDLLAEAWPDQPEAVRRDAREALAALVGGGVLAV